MSQASLVARSGALLRQDDPGAALECAFEALESARGEKAVQLLALCACVDAQAKGAASRAEEAAAVANGFDSHLAKASALLALVKAQLMNHQESKDALAVLREIGATWGETALLLGLAQEAAKDWLGVWCLDMTPGIGAGPVAVGTSQAEQEQVAGSIRIARDYDDLTAQGGESFECYSGLSGLRQAERCSHWSYRSCFGHSEAASLWRNDAGPGGEIHDRLSVASKSGKRLAQAWATLDLADAKLCQGSQVKVPDLEDAQQQLQKLGSKEGLAVCKLEACELLTAFRPKAANSRANTCIRLNRSCEPQDLDIMVTAARHTVQDRRSTRTKLPMTKSNLKEEPNVEADTTDAGSTASEAESGRCSSSAEVSPVQMDLLWPDKPLPPGQIQRGQERFATEI
eukprot:s148_g28.t1